MPACAHDRDDGYAAAGRRHRRPHARLRGAGRARPWLDSGAPREEIARLLLTPPRVDALVAHPVGRAVNSAANDGPSLREPAAPEPPRQRGLFGAAARAWRPTVGQLGGVTFQCVTRGAWHSSRPAPSREAAASSNRGIAGSMTG